MPDNSIQRPTTPATITLSDGKERVLRYSIGTMKKLRTAFGATSLLKDGLQNIDEDKLPILIWHGLVHEDPTLTVEQVEELIDAQMLAYVMSRFSLAFGGKATKNEPAPEIPNPPVTQPVQ
jgi:hypothetical protein